MGSLCCCLRGDDREEDDANLNNTVCRNCICLPLILQNFIHMHSSLFRREGEQTMSSSVQGTGSLTNYPSSMDDSFISVYRSPPRPLPYGADPRCFCVQRDGLILRREKGSNHELEETEPLRSTDTNDVVSSTNKWNNCVCEKGSKELSSMNSVKLFSAAQMVAEYVHICSNCDDEDVCPTCFEEYIPENPKIVTKCSHHFHLGCIYEWMERSENCPVCGKVMEFDETACLF